ncbi:MAG: 50S ribosomal protein L4 [Candidatus Nanoarchaeia archaeon]|nr:50S ribosomal protein L4 [Candidatus Nanoarchaeia archaeon]MDD5499871.1 50S ribosomal protein L4 [Candidatus Nanoarchaeia archaeon]
MKAEILSIKGEKKGKIDLPKQFLEKHHPNLIKRAFNSNMSLTYQHHGTDILAGLRRITKTRKRRNVYRTGYGRGASRIPKKIMSRRGNRLNFIADKAPQTRKGRVAHPPLVEKVFEEKINLKERLFAIRSAISATIKKEIIEKRNHKISGIELPLIIEGAEKLKKTSEVKKMLESIGLKDELKRASQRKVRPGIGKMRGRKYKTKKGPLIIASKNCDLIKSSKSMQGIESVQVNNLNVTLLAPGGEPGRITVWTKEAINELAEKNLFMGGKK